VYFNYYHKKLGSNGPLQPSTMKKDHPGGARNGK